MTLGLVGYITVVLCAIALFSVRITNTLGTDGSVRKWSPVALLGAAILIVFQGTRDQVGTDYRAYQELYGLVDQDDLYTAVQNSPQEPVFTTLVFLSKTVDLGFQGFMLAVSAVTVLSVYAALRLLRLNLAAGFAFYCLLGSYTAGFNITRQALATALVLLAYALWTNRSVRRRVASAIVGLLAVGIHLAAALPLAAVVLLAAYYSGRRGYIFWAIPAFAAFQGVELALGGSGGIFGSRYAGYIEAVAVTPGKIALLLMYSVVSILLFSAYRFSQPTVRGRVELAIVFLSVAIVLVSLLSPYVERLAFYFFSFGTLLAARLFGERGARQSGKSDWLSDKRGAAILGLSAVGVVYFGFGVSRYADLIPYTSWLM